ncbi:nucleotidyltransferase domain-containing protein [bacterium]|nr:nucleotidyltransferase domain-containing protein [bacterium]
MIENLYITNSKVRRDILTLFFCNPSKKYYIRKLERLLGYSVGNIAREIKKLNKDELFLTEREGNLVYYKLNQNHPLYNEIKSIMMKSSGILQRIKEVLSSIQSIDIAFVYGSFPTNEAKTTSDIDVMIIGNPDSKEIVNKLRILESKFDREINFTLYTMDEFLEKKDKIEFLKEVMKKKKIPLIGNIYEIK